jgi:hypothetical protein
VDSQLELLSELDWELEKDWELDWELELEEVVPISWRLRRVDIRMFIIMLSN